MKIPQLRSLKNLFGSDPTPTAHTAVPSSLESPELEFRVAIGPVRPVKVTETAIKTEPPQPDAAMSRKDEAEVLVELAAIPNDPNQVDGADRLQYLANGYPPKILKQLKRGSFTVQDELDLHHMPLKQARECLSAFFVEIKLQGYTCIRLIHGKGLRSGERGPVLKSMLDRDLRQRADVLAFASAPGAQGGTGALLVLMKKQR